MDSDLALRITRARATQDWLELSAALAAAVPLAEDPVVRLGLLRELASTLEERLGDRDDAIARRFAMLEIDATDLDTFAALGRMLGAAERWMDLVAIREREAELAGDGARLVAVLGELESLYRTQLCDEERADEIASRRRGIAAD